MLSVHAMSKEKMVTFKKLDVAILRKFSLNQWLEECELHEYVKNMEPQTLDMTTLGEIVTLFKKPNYLPYDNWPFYIHLEAMVT